jgi:hypothetical protein
MAWKLLKFLRWATDSTKPALNSAGAVIFCTDSKRAHVNTGTGWVGMDTPPIGATYMQFPDYSAPGTLWPNTTWVDRSTTNVKLAGRVPRVEGTANSGGANAAAAFGSTQDDQAQGHLHGITPITDWNVAGAATGILQYNQKAATTDRSTGVPTVSGANGTPRTGPATRDASVTVRIFERTA